MKSSYTWDLSTSIEVFSGFRKEDFGPKLLAIRTKDWGLHALVLRLIPEYTPMTAKHDVERKISGLNFCNMLYMTLLELETARFTTTSRR